MPRAKLRLIKRCAEFKSRDEISQIPPKTRGIYILLKFRPRLKMYDVVYVGMSSLGQKCGARSRLKAHAKSKRKGARWTHFSIFEVWDNIAPSEIEELEGLFRHIYRKDTRANKLNRSKRFGKLRKVRSDNFGDW